MQCRVWLGLNPWERGTGTTGGNVGASKASGSSVIRGSPGVFHRKRTEGNGLSFTCSASFKIPSVSPILTQNNELLCGNKLSCRSHISAA